MYKRFFFILALCLAGWSGQAGQGRLGRASVSPPTVFAAQASSRPGANGMATFRLPVVPAANGMATFRFPVVPGATISGYFDHQPAAGLVTIYNGGHSSPGAGFYFSCSAPAMYDWVGCEDPVGGAEACSASRQLWYDGHKGTDFEFSADWNTGATCDPARFNGITLPIYAPARGKVLMAGTDPNRPANGWHIRLMHDLNGDGNFNNDNFRSIYLHFTANALAVVPGQIVEEGQYLGLGGSTGYSSSPHLHFEVQRSSDYFQTTYWSVDPYGWQGAGSDPWPYANENLWQQQAPVLNNFTRLPYVSNISPQCAACGQLLQNGDFEAGQTAWSEQGGTFIRMTGDPELTVTPYSGNSLAWLGGQVDTVSVLNQDFVVPAGVSGGSLRYRILVQSSETGGAQDYFYIRLRKLDGTVLQDVELQDNQFSVQNQWVLRELALINLAPFQGQTVRLNIKATNSSAGPTSFYLDDIVLLGTSP